MSDDDEPGKTVIRVDISHELGSFLHDQNFSAFTSAFDESPILGVERSSFGLVLL